MNKNPLTIPRSSQSSYYFSNRLDCRALDGFLNMNKDGVVFPSLKGYYEEDLGALKHYQFSLAKVEAAKRFDPFHDHLTTLILNDEQVQWNVNRLICIQELKQMGY